MATFWELITGQAGTGGMGSTSGSYIPSATSMRGARGAYQPSPISMRTAGGGTIPGRTTSTSYVAPSTAAGGSDVINKAYEQQMGDLAKLGGSSNLRALIGEELARQQAPDLTEADPSYFGMSPEELLAFILDSGGGGVDLSGYNAMLGDIASRETALGTRKAEQEAFLADLFDAAEARATADKAALAAAVEAQLTSDAARRATEMETVRAGDVNRAAAATAAREALGAPTGPDLTAQTVENVASGIAAGGSVADRDARIRESIANQQYAREIAGLTPMEQMATMQLGSMYEDRLAALASERAQIQAQMAQARSAGSRGPSPSERLGALQFLSEAFAAPEAPEAPGVLGGLNAIESFYGPTVAADIASIGDQVLSTAFMSTIDPTKAADVSEVLQTIRQQDPAIDSYLNQNPGFTGLVVNYITQAAKGFN